MERTSPCGGGMSDIVERLRAWVYTDSQYATAREAADEIERLRQVSAQKNFTLTDEQRESLLASLSGKTGGPLAHAPQPTLTDAEREAINGAILEMDAIMQEFVPTPVETRLRRQAATLRCLLARFK